MHELRLIVQPDADEPGCAEVYVDGLINDKPYRFLLDTGAAKSSVIADDYTSAFEAIDTHRSSGVFASREAGSDTVISVPSIAVGTIRKANFALTRSAGNPHVSSLIGMDFLNHHRCYFDFEQNRVLVDADDQPATSILRPLLMDNRFHPYVEIAFEPSAQAAAKAVWDTGASITVVDTNFIHQHPALFERAGQSFGTDSSGTQVETPMYRMQGSIIGGETFPAVRVAAVDLAKVNATIEIPMDLILGYNLYSKANWLFDFPRKQWGITKRLNLS